MQTAKLDKNTTNNQIISQWGNKNTKQEINMTCNEGQNKVQNEALEQIYTRQGRDKIIEGGLRIH